ncbi:MAG: peroxide stress protein YaaA, partial [Bacteroidota bacterium]
KNLYEFWEQKITRLINEDLESQKEKSIINLASKEYFHAVDPQALNGNLYNIHFKEERNGQFKIISFSAKKARGMMCHFVIKNKIKKPQHLKAFDYDNYLFNEDLSDANNFVFTR